tara:strand:- start:782 stop:961 length:180 start_codon:yes stop_codon:yes gene_type:complete
MTKYKLKRKIKTLTKYEFYALCSKYLISVDIALENEQLINLLKNKASNETIEQCLMDQF